MNCACETSDDGKVYSPCGAHHAWLREVEESRKPKVGHQRPEAEAKTVTVIQVVYLKGAGTENDAYRRATAWFLLDGTLLVEHDPALKK